MSMKKWTDEELVTTRDSLEAWNSRNNNSGSGSKLWLFTAFLGAFAISTGVAFFFLDGLDVKAVVFGKVLVFRSNHRNGQIGGNLV